MLCKRILALILWCHCYQIVLNPIFHLLAIVGVSSSGHYHFNGHLNSIGQSNQDSNHFLAFNHIKNSYYVEGSTIMVDANQVALTPGHEIKLKCNVSEFPDEQFTWYRTRRYSNKQQPQLDRDRERLSSDDDRFIINNNVLIIKYPTIADQGDYYCTVNEPRYGVETEKMISVKARPFILDFDLETNTLRSATASEGKPLKLVCNVVDDYSPHADIKISWHMSKFDENDMDPVIDREDGIRIENYNATSQALIIDHVTKDHRRFYKCHATNGVTENSKVIFIRVRDKFTVIWPTVGIFIELVILIGVICIVENRKVEPDKDAYDRKAIQM